MDAVMDLDDLVQTAGLTGAEIVRAPDAPTGGTVITDVTHDSRQVGPGSLFVCVPGARADGHDHADDAIARGAVALLCERRLPVGVSQVVVADSRARMADVASTFWGRPSERLQMVGVTGTSGKTSVTALVGEILLRSGREVRQLGTLSGPRTTPEATDLQRQLRVWADEGVEAVAMEVSSHALQLHRVDATRFDVAVFTNLGHDHLDFHGDMEQYFAAKARLFESGRAACAVVNRGDPAGRRLLDGLEIEAVTFALDDAEQIVLRSGRTDFRWRGVEWTTRLLGRHNVANIMAAALSTERLGVPVEQAARALAEVPPVPGRMESVHAPGSDLGVIVDYAHKPEALEAALATCRELSDGTVWVVFGAGGDRDRDKRPMMGEVAARMADRVVLTSDNPRTENPRSIIDDIRGGVPGASVIEERGRAIATAIEQAAAGDVVLIAGKGHETVQIVGTSAQPFDDRQHASSALAARIARRPAS